MICAFYENTVVIRDTALRKVRKRSEESQEEVREKSEIIYLKRCDGGVLTDINRFTSESTEQQNFLPLF